MTVSHIVPRPGPRRRRTPELIARCIERYVVDNISLYDIGMMEGCGANAIKGILVEAGIEIRGRGVASDSFRFTADRRRYGDEQRDAA